MKKSILITAAIIAYCILVTANCFSQGTAINNSGTAADSSAIIDASSTTQGLLIPRMTEAQKNAVPRPAPSLMIYQTDGTQPGYYFNAGDKTTKNWVYIGADDMGNHTATDSLNMSMKKIYNLATCTQNFDAANKLYVDGKVGAGGGTSGGFFPGGLTKGATELSAMSDNTYNFLNACVYCDTLTEGNNSDWHVPSMEDIVNMAVLSPGSLTDRANTNYFWTSTPDASWPYGMMVVSLGSNYLTSVNWSDTSRKVRCAR